MKVLIDIPDKEYNRIKNKTEVNYSEMWIAEGTPLDGLTNGEVAKAVFGLKSKDLSLKFRTQSWWNRKWGE